MDLNLINKVLDCLIEQSNPLVIMNEAAQFRLP
jgi:hypothetical protein